MQQGGVASLGLEGDCTLMAAMTSLFSAHPVKPDERQTHDHKYETQCGETHSLKTQERYVSLVRAAEYFYKLFHKHTWIFGLEFRGSWLVGTMRT